jgi:alpha-galactosidase
MDSEHREIAHVRYTAVDVRPDQLDDAVWALAQPISITHYWSGEFADPSRHAEARVLWTPNALVARFEANQFEPQVISNAPEINRKTLGLWDRDVCEIFIAPNPEDPYRYFEFEGAPTGEFVDLAVRLEGEFRDTDWDFKSGMTTVSRNEENKVITCIRVPWSAVIGRPVHGDEWLGNLCRCVGTEENRGYLAWQPTLTEKANFHVPEKFGRFRFE